MKEIEYQIVSSTNIDDLEKQVNDLIQKGFMPFERIQKINRLLIQTMLKYEPIFEIPPKEK